MHWIITYNLFVVDRRLSADRNSRRILYQSTRVSSRGEREIYIHGAHSRVPPVHLSNHYRATNVADIHADRHALRSTALRSALTFHFLVGNTRACVYVCTAYIRDTRRGRGGGRWCWDLRNARVSRTRGYSPSCVFGSRGGPSRESGAPLLIHHAKRTGSANIA